MSRTAHHVPSRHRILPAFWALGLPGPWTGHAMPELRYSHAELARARRGGRRPVPRRVVRSFTSYTYSRALNERTSSPYERRARAALQAFRAAAHRELRAAAADPAATAEALPRRAEDLDHPPVRHRHRDLRDA
ncbi:hypothetical protein DI272_36570 [Streptomyces sp. Act143]|uniref:hypothetical protein n=1 Tax=Streptomyces sp. Act143 TaxID=2200760 RepID=UPI000D682116|nr:hypothetical protein [Streptomyces sp. Act143]PWI19057.1 hypothetical protein DI272_36570 [Streptomyces sp. Act143]